MTDRTDHSEAVGHTKYALKDFSAEMNFEAWARNAAAFIRTKGLESEFSDWCGGWPVGVAGTARLIASAPALLGAGKKLMRADSCPSDLHLRNEAWAALRAAIQAATGGSDGR